MKETSFDRRKKCSRPWQGGQVVDIVAEHHAVLVEPQQ